MFSSDPVGVAASVQRSEDCPQQQERHQRLPAGRILHGYRRKHNPSLICIHLKHVSTSCPAGKSQAPVFDVFEAFITTDNIQVFANAATDYIMCLMKFVKGLGWSQHDIKPAVSGDQMKIIYLHF